KVDSLALNNSPVSNNDTNVMFLNQGQVGNIQVRITGTVLAGVTNVSMGPDITINGAPMINGNVVTIPFTVANPATPGVRNLTLTNSVGGERLFVPAYVEILGVGALQVAPS